MTTVPTFLQIIFAGSLIAAAGAMLGAFALLRRMALVGDALSHVALPGIALGLLWHVHPFLGSLAFLLCGTTMIWFVEHRTRLAVETLVGVVFVMALAFGALLTPQMELLETLFGDIAKITTSDFFLAVILAVSMIALLLIFSKNFTLSMVSSDLALASGLKPAALEFLYLTMFAVMVAIGIKFTGLLLLGALIIIPAAIVRNFSSSMASYLAGSALVGVAGAVAGMVISRAYGLPTGPVFTLLLGSLFFLSVPFGRR